MSQVGEQEKIEKKTVKPAPVVHETVQRDLSEVNGPEGGMLPESVSSKIQSMRGSGQKLSERNLAHYSSKFGRDMSDVHVHTDTASDTISRSLNARAFTIGSDVFLTKGINPDGGGRDAQTMTHELTHVVQQGGHASSGPLKLGAADTSQEHEAESTAMREFEPTLEGQQDTIQRGFFSDLGGSIGHSVLNMMGMEEAYQQVFGGVNKVKAAIAKMEDQDRNEFYILRNNIFDLENPNNQFGVVKTRMNASRLKTQYEKQQKAIEAANPGAVPAAPAQNRVEEQTLNNAIENYNRAYEKYEDLIDKLLKKVQKIDSEIKEDDFTTYLDRESPHGSGGPIAGFYGMIAAKLGGSIMAGFSSGDKEEARTLGGKNAADYFGAKKRKKWDFEKVQKGSDEDVKERFENQKQKISHKAAKALYASPVFRMTTPWLDDVAGNEQETRSRLENIIKTSEKFKPFWDDVEQRVKDHDLDKNGLEQPALIARAMRLCKELLTETQNGGNGYSTRDTSWENFRDMVYDKLPAELKGQNKPYPAKDDLSFVNVFGPDGILGDDFLRIDGMLTSKVPFKIDEEATKMADKISNEAYDSMTKSGNNYNSEDIEKKIKERKREEIVKEVWKKVQANPELKEKFKSEFLFRKIGIMKFDSVINDGLKENEKQENIVDAVLEGLTTVDAGEKEKKKA